MTEFMRARLAQARSVIARARAATEEHVPCHLGQSFFFFFFFKFIYFSMSCRHGSAATPPVHLQADPCCGVTSRKLESPPCCLVTSTPGAGRQNQQRRSWWSMNYVTIAFQS